MEPSERFQFQTPVVDVLRMQIAPFGARPTAANSARFGPSAPDARTTTHIVAHRGFHDPTTYENTVDAYRRAAEIGVDLVEVDIRRTADGVLVLHHDASIAGRRISTTDFADLPKLPNGQVISTLQGLVDAAAGARGGTRLLVETKEFGYEAEIVNLLRSRLGASSFELMSFNHDSVRALRQLAPDAKVGVLFGLVPDWKNGTWPISGAAMVQQSRELKVDFVAIDRRIADDGRLDALAAAGLKTAVWTVDSRIDLRRFLHDSRVYRVITDAPDTAKQMRDG